ncbi:histidine phosphatase family protein [Luteimonas sp. 3794]|uniref:histidine phosphatase family protein n=1 Tax=Luteimonas sp. 3794 TaxID=2817730 RepID=UPI002858A7D1|nr:histidine phosphatase family protein [Luteimonas sp. 3794]MDR6993103.1 broad specificity phosphatase PhoE [Luteimonas sp. 3794]
MARLRHSDWPDRLWVVRHGQSAGNVARDAAELAQTHLIDLDTRDADTPLSALGHQQSRALAAWFAALPPEERPNVLLTSPFLRAQQTIHAVADALQIERAEISVDERLREKEFGVLDRYTVSGIKATFPELAAQRASVGKFYFRPPGGESWCDVILRLRSVTEVLRRDHVGDRVLIVAHQVIVNCFRYLLECMDEAQILGIDQEADVPNCSITAYALDRQQPDARFELEVANLALPLQAEGMPVTCEADRPAGAR